MAKISTRSHSKTLTISDQGDIKKFSRHTETVTTRSKTGRQKTDTALDWTNRITMIGITIFTLSIGSVITQFNGADLASFTPNYTLRNEFESVDDPLTHYNYIPYGENALSTIVGWIQLFGSAGSTAKNLWDTIGFFVTLGAYGDVFYGTFSAEFGQVRFDELLGTYSQISTSAAIYSLLTNTEKTWILNNYTNQTLMSDNEKLIFYGRRFSLLYIVANQIIADILGASIGDWLWFINEPSVYDMIESLV